MRLLSLTLALLIGGTPLWAQGWTAQNIRDEVFDSGRVAMPGNMVAISCAAATGRATVTPESRWWEVSTAPPWQYLLVFADPMVPAPPNTFDVQMTLFADQTGYRLPPVVLNELEGGWQVALPMSDPMFAAAATASRLILQVGAQTVWELPVAGLAQGLDSARALCGATWTARGIAAPEAAAAPAQQPDRLEMEQVAQNAAARICGGMVHLGPHAVKSGNIDGDGHADVILDYNDITCGPQKLRPNFCGASTCSIDVFLSKTFPVTGRPENLIGMSAATVPLSNGNIAVSASGNLGMCQSTAPCAFLFYWDGARFTDLPQ